MIEFRMPALGADMEAGTLVEWMKSAGDPVKRGDIIAVVETQKGAIEIEVFHNGTFVEARAAPGDEVPVGGVLALLQTEGEDRSEPAQAPTEEPLTEPKSEASIKPAPARPSRDRGKLKITPAARRRAQHLGVDATQITPDATGVIGLREVEAHKKQPVRPQGQKPRIDLKEMRKALAAAMTRAKREIPHYYVSSDLDLTATTTWIANENQNRAVSKRLLYAAPLIKATALALRKVPELNGTFIDNKWQPSDAVHLGIGVSLRGGGLIAPALHDVDQLGVDQIMRQLTDLVGRVRGGRLRSSEMTDATVTLSNLGDKTADILVPVIYPPQVAIIGCGQISRKPRVWQNAITIRDCMTVTVAGDHRVSDGRRAAVFLNFLQSLLEEPATL